MAAGVVGLKVEMCVNQNTITSQRGSCASGSYRQWPVECQPGQLSFSWAVRPGINSMQEQQCLFVTYIFDHLCKLVTLTIFKKIFPLSPTRKALYV
jgi:hypothetical protein